MSEYRTWKVVERHPNMNTFRYNLVTPRDPVGLLGPNWDTRDKCLGNVPLAEVRTYLTPEMVWLATK